MATTPSGRKQQLAAVLRYLRDRKSIMQEAVGRRLRPAATVRRSQNKIAQLESGKQGISQEDLVALLEHLRGHRRTVALARALRAGAAQPGRWREYRTVYPKPLCRYLELEKDAQLIRLVSREEIPEVLQCEAYGRAGFALTSPLSRPRWPNRASVRSGSGRTA
jgi:helix-turn-helix protein/uncharacterized protein DUF5753